MKAYIRAHWRGELSLAQSYWVNLIALSALVAVASNSLEQPLSTLSLQNVVIAGFSFLLLACVITIWQFVGVWRSATNTSTKTKRSFWPAVAKTLTGLGTFIAAANTVTVASDLLSLVRALQDPNLVECAIERRGRTDLIFTGAINERSVAELLTALQNRSIEILRVNSHGGLVDPAIQLSRYIRVNNVMVMAEGQCISACVLLLAASPYAAIHPDTEVSFHRFEAVAEFANPELRAQSSAYLADAELVYQEFGLADWAIETARHQQFWTPTVHQQIAMGLILFIYDPEQNLFLNAQEYCAQHPLRCSR